MARYRFDFGMKDQVRQSWEAEFNDDEQAKLAAEGMLNAADSHITSVAIHERARLVGRIERA